MLNPTLKFAALFFLALGTAQCSDVNTLSSHVSISFKKAVPIVNPSDITINAGSTNEHKIKGPWITNGIQVINSTTKRLTITTYNYEIKGTVNGYTTKTVFNIDFGTTCASSGRYNVAILGGTNPVTPGTAGAAPGQLYPFTDGLIRSPLPNEGNGSSHTFTALADGCHAESAFNSSVYEMAFIDGLPATDHYIYDITLNITGYFSNCTSQFLDEVCDDSIVERFSQTAYFHTQ
ncbi:MAG: hypothetical protein ABL927_02015 [Bdellovibrionales bacterium]